MDERKREKIKIKAASLEELLRDLEFYERLVLDMESKRIRFLSRKAAKARRDAYRELVGDEIAYLTNINNKL